MTSYNHEKDCKCTKCLPYKPKAISGSVEVSRVESKLDQIIVQNQDIIERLEELAISVDALKVYEDDVYDDGEGF